MTQITGFHVHIYFDKESVTQARRICETIRDIFNLDMGRIHERLVGPHPRWSCQLGVSPMKIGDVLSWLTLNREGLTVFIHAETGDELKDHTEHAIWMGEMLELDLSIFN